MLCLAYFSVSSQGWHYAITAGLAKVVVLLTVQFYKRFRIH